MTRRRHGRRLRLFFAAALLCGAGASAIAGEQPSAVEVESTGMVSGPARLSGGQGADSSAGLQAATLSVRVRRPLPAANWFGSIGAQQENIWFSRPTAGISRLQDHAVSLALERFERGEAVAAVMVRPGQYFGRTANRASWDVPVDVYSSVPITDGWSGVVGVSNGRFLHHAMPVAGIVVDSIPSWRFEAVFPEPAVTFTPSAQTRIRFGATLDGGGFLVETPAGRTPLEYYSYELGPEIRQRTASGGEWAVSAGVELERSLDRFRQNDRRHGSGAAFVKLRLTWGR